MGWNVCPGRSVLELNALVVRPALFELEVTVCIVVCLLIHLTVSHIVGLVTDGS